LALTKTLIVPLWLVSQGGQAACAEGSVNELSAARTQATGNQPRLRGVVEAGRARHTRVWLTLAVTLPALALGLSGWYAWDAAVQSARAEVSRTADAAAQYARRLLEAQALRLDRANDLLAGLSDDRS
jgi:hypothetical protein